MPFDRVEQLPESVRHSLPQHAQEIYLSAFNSAWKNYRDPEQRQGDDDLETVAHKVAWQAVKQAYVKKAGHWRKK